ncbi:alpha/beta fold hydrolase [Mycolicibacterium tusciae]|jgi:pimeloyl-ACP methyl ester carboxylesterase|uniref:AB hydrolase-1 domain-containing protein n=1 Tax=Mycolicibacterium tusciae TaxID=75922 RepID=A0A1X0JKJ4_9MYCO|nr:alpha/beta fold hydrolase [Mycolicibacterium tusciae]ORB63403.1 hypothetical protein BST47_19845 [Mycolicibacterium tusciae]
MATFALVHGAWHGAWCWERLTPELEKLGHRVITMDLPIDDSSATFDDYADIVCRAVDHCSGEDLVLVGHSLAGLTVPLVAARRPLRRVVYLCALLPKLGVPLTQQMAEDTVMLNPDYAKGLGDKDSEGRRAWVDEVIARRHLFDDCDEAVASAAVARLCPQATNPYRIPCSLSEMPTVDSTYVLCTEDRIVNPVWSRRIARERMRAELIELPGSHSPFLSRPRDLAAVLDGVG